MKLFVWRCSYIEEASEVLGRMIRERSLRWSSSSLYRDQKSPGTKEAKEGSDLFQKNPSIVRKRMLFMDL